MFAPGSADRGTSREEVRIPAERYSAITGEALLAGERSAPRVGSLVWSPDGTQFAYSLTGNAHDYNRYEIWVCPSKGKGARRVSPEGSAGYIAPVWIDNDRLGALSPSSGKFRVVSMDVVSGAVSGLGEIGSSDCDWSPDRSHIAWAASQAYRPADSDSPTGLRVTATGISDRH
jgi:hypothetical protein